MKKTDQNADQAVDLFPLRMKFVLIIALAFMASFAEFGIGGAMVGFSIGGMIGMMASRE